jgi:hypothetical protein
MIEARRDIGYQGKGVQGLGYSAKFRVIVCLCIALLLSAGAAAADTGGSIAGTVKDIAGGVIPDVVVHARNVDTSVQQTTKTNADGYYAFPALPVGHYEIALAPFEFRPYKRTGLVIDVNTRIQVDVTLEMGEESDQITVSESAVHVDTETTQMGEVVAGTQMTAVALNGRSFTDLLSLQPGIVPMSTQLPDSVVMAGAQVAIAPSGGLNPGNQSISGQREDANGFVVNGGDVKEMMNGGTTIVPNLDSISEFRVLTNNFDAEYGNYSGGIVNVITKSGTNQWHGDAFEFLRNTNLDARNFFSPERDIFQQNQFGGTLGGPVRKDKLFFFADYQGTRSNEGIDTGLISVPSVADRSGNLADQASIFTKTEIELVGGKPIQVVVPTTVSGPNLASQLTQKLGYTVTTGEDYYTPACAPCVFPNAVIPMTAWSAPAVNLLPYIPVPTAGPATFSTGAQTKKLRDDKTSIRADYNTQRWGTISAYYYFDDYRLDNPYPTGQGGANVPGFNAITSGRGQLINLGDTKTLGNSSVNEFRLSFMRSANDVGQPVGGVSPTLASQGFAAGSAGGIVPLAPAIEGVENIFFNSFTMGVPITNLRQWNNTYSLNDNFSKIIKKHTLKAGMEFSLDQVNVNPNATFNGSFAFFGSETGSDFADFLIGVASNYNQADSMSYYPRHKYLGGFLQDSWQAKPSLTLNFGVRWELLQYWSEKYNQIPAMLVGQQSQVFTNAPAGIVYPTDRGIPNTLVPEGNRFSPRLGIAYSPEKTKGLLGKIMGEPGKMSIRAGFGIYYSVIQGNTIAFDQPQPPYGLSYTSPAPPLFATPFISAADGTNHVQPFPLTFPSLNASVTNPNSAINFSAFEPIAGMTGPNPNNTYPYNENYFLSIERQLSAGTVLSLSYVGSEAHHLLLVYSANPGNPALCLSLSQQSAVAPDTPRCGPFAEDATYTPVGGQPIHGTRGPLGHAFSNDDYEGSVGNSNYNSFQIDFRHSGNRLNFSLGYTFSKSIDQGSSLADVANPFNFQATRALSSFDLKHNFVANYEVRLPFERFLRHSNRLTLGWSISGITRASTGFPVTLSTNGDNSLMGSIPNGVNNHSLDLPDFLGGALNLNHNPRNGLQYFGASKFAINALGTPGNSPRRFFYGPGMFNTDLALLKSFEISETKTLQFRLETFNTFNHTQFFGPGSVNGDISTSLFGQVVKAAPPRLMQAALKFIF